MEFKQDPKTILHENEDHMKSEDKVNKSRKKGPLMVYINLIQVPPRSPDSSPKRITTTWKKG